MKREKAGYIYLLLVFVIWGSLYVVSKIVLNKLPVLTVSFLRFLIAGSVMGIILWRKGPAKIQKQDFRYILLLGIVGYFLAAVAQLIGTQLAGATVASLVNSLNPVVVLFVAAAILKEKLNWQKIVGVVVSLIGVYLIIGGSSGGALLGIVAALCSVVMWSLVTVIMRRIMQKYDPFQVTTYGIWVAAVVSLPVAIVEAVHTKNMTVDVPTVLGLLYMGIVCTGVAHFLWGKSLSLLPASICSMFYPIQPITAVLLGIVLLGEPMTVWIAVGGVLIIGGVLFSLKYSSTDQDSKTMSKCDGC